MADRTADLQLEDALSSIRRLVRDEQPTAKEPAAPEGDKLVLTPALRIVPEKVAQREEPPLVLDRTAKPPKADVSALEATIAELEAAVGVGADFEPDGSEDEPALTPPPAMFRSNGQADTATTGPRGRLSLRPTNQDTPAPTDAPVSEPSATKPTPDSSAVEDDEVLLDEETLREIVAEIVREELKGAFGEQITRNIRKLVRREIHEFFDVRDGE